MKERVVLLCNILVFVEVHVSSLFIYSLFQTHKKTMYANSNLISSPYRTNVEPFCGRLKIADQFSSLIIKC